MSSNYAVDENRTGRVKVHKDHPDDPASIWASCDLQSKERMKILTEADKVIDTDAVPAHKTIGTVDIDGDDIDFTADDSIVADYGWDN